MPSSKKPEEHGNQIEMEQRPPSIYASKEKFLEEALKQLVQKKQDDQVHFAVAGVTLSLLGAGIAAGLLAGMSENVRKRLAPILGFPLSVAGTILGVLTVGIAALPIIAGVTGLSQAKPSTSETPYSHAIRDVLRYAEEEYERLERMQREGDLSKSQFKSEVDVLYDDVIGLLQKVTEGKNS